MKSLGKKLSHRALCYDLTKRTKNNKLISHVCPEYIGCCCNHASCMSEESIGMNVTRIHLLHLLISVTLDIKGIIMTGHHCNNIIVLFITLSWV